MNHGPAAAKTASSPGLAPAAGRLALSAEPIRVAALGYVASNGAARLHDADVVDQLAALERFCALRGWDLAALVHEVEPTRPRCARPALAYAWSE